MTKEFRWTKLDNISTEHKDSCLLHAIGDMNLFNVLVLDELLANPPAVELFVSEFQCSAVSQKF